MWLHNGLFYHLHCAHLKISLSPHVGLHIQFETLAHQHYHRNHPRRCDPGIGLCLYSTLALLIVINNGSTTLQLFPFIHTKTSMFYYFNTLSGKRQSFSTVWCLSINRHNVWNSTLLNTYWPTGVVWAGGQVRSEAPSLILGPSINCHVFFTNKSSN